MKTTIIAVILGCVLTFVLSAPAITHGDTITVNANNTAIEGDSKGMVLRPFVDPPDGRLGQAVLQLTYEPSGVRHLFNLTGITIPKGKVVTVGIQYANGSIGVYNDLTEGSWPLSDSDGIDRVTLECPTGVYTCKTPADFPDNVRVESLEFEPLADLAAAARFIVVGDTGTGRCEQYQVARALKNWCNLHGCHFALLLGDNIYEEGAASCSDTQFRTVFEDPYGPEERLKKDLATCPLPPNPYELDGPLAGLTVNPLNIPINAVLGNHDYKQTFWQVAGNEADYAKGVCTPAFRSEKWRMMGDKTPSQTDRYYSFKQGNVVRFLALDTQPMVVETWQDTPSYPKGKPSPDQKGRQQTYVKDQQTFFVDTVLQPMETLWHIAFGHHPYISNGPHGNAGNYDNLSCPTSLKTEDKERKDNPRLSPGWQCGLQMRDFMESLCAQELDLYLSGHDHSLQWLSKDCGSRKVEFIVSGAGAGGDKLTTVKDKNQDPAVDVRFTPAGKTPGFVYLVVNDTQIDVQLVDASTPETPRCIKRGTLTKTARGAPVRFAENTCM